MPDTAATTPARPSFAEAFRFWLKLGFISFGGPTGQIAILYAELVERKRWISRDRFLHALNFCMLLPGPEAQQLCIYIGWLLHGTLGGIVAGVLFVIPSVFILYALSCVYVFGGKLTVVNAAFYGLQPAVVAIVALAVVRIGQKALHHPLQWAIAAAAYVALAMLKVPFPIVILGAGVAGFIAHARGVRIGGVTNRDREGTALKNGSDVEDRSPTGAARTDEVRADKDRAVAAVIDDHHETPEHARPSLARALRVLATCLALWWLPVAALGLWLGWDHTVPREGLFFSGAAMVTFGGAYAVLPYVAQQAVERYGWLTTEQTVAGLALAETTPGPLIMVLQFVGFLAGWNHPRGLPPLAAATLGAFITTWATFLPCFLYIFLGAPYIERLRGEQRISAVLSAITSAVVGVVLNLALWFAFHVAFPGVETWSDWAINKADAFAIVLAIAAGAGLWRFKWNLVWVVLACGAAGVVWRLVMN